MKKLVPALLTLAAFAAVTARADTVGFTTAGGFALSGALFDTLGYTFTLAAPIQVTQLGFWDFNANGLEAAVPVTLWNSAGTVQATATVPAGANANELNQYLYVTLATPVTLAAGTYTLGAYVTGGDDAFQGQITTITPAAGITYGASRAGTGTGDPTTDVFNNPRSYFGPNFQFVVPEPSTWAMLGSGVVGAGVTVLRRRQHVA